jgi:hypothetical protein
MAECRAPRPAFPWRSVALCAWTALTVTAQSSTLTLPHVSDHVFGGGYNCAPFLNNLVPLTGLSGAALGARAQLIYDNSHFSAGGASGLINITMLAFRPNANGFESATSFPVGAAM